MDPELHLRVILVDPPSGVAFCLQSGREQLVDITRSAGSAITFDFTVRVEAQKDGKPNFLGAFAQGTPSDRFVYVNSGMRAAQADTVWDRRAKITLRDLEWPLIEEALATPGAVLEARVQGRAGDGGPCCASVPLLEGGWTLKPGA